MRCIHTVCAIVLTHVGIWVCAAVIIITILEKLNKAVTMLLTDSSKGVVMQSYGVVRNGAKFNMVFSGTNSSIPFIVIMKKSCKID